MCNRAVSDFSFLFVRGQTVHNLNLEMSGVTYFPGTHPTPTAIVQTYIGLQGILGPTGG